MNNIYLIGMMGAGKTVFGNFISEKTGKKFVDLDHVIEDRLGLSIPQVFESHGQAYFRLQEANCLREVSGADAQIVATGGGAVLNPQNLKRMKETGTILYLQASLETLWNRVKGDSNRPLLKTENPEEQMRILFRDRKKIYENAADKVLDADQLEDEQAREKLMEEIQDIL